VKNVALARVVGLFCIFAIYGFASERNVTHSDAISVKQSLDRLCVTGSVLMIAAHPDDENTALISYLARGRNVRTAYLSLTRGEGGQNVIGPETGAELGLIRTEELLQSRRVDGGQQFFSRAIDFGFSKNPQEAMSKWGHDAVLGDVVWIIRKFRPDVVILQFTGTPQDGHGQHQASAILGKEAFAISGDASKYPEQLKFVRPWQAKRLMVNRRAFTPEMQKEIDALPGKLQIDLGTYDPLIGYSYGELAGISRSFNSSQSDGTPRVRGTDKTTLVTLKGSPAKNDLFDGIDISWRRYSGGAAVGKLLDQASAEWNPTRPADSIPLLEKARELAQRIDDPGAERKIADIDETIAKCAGLWLDFTANPQDVVSGRPATLRVTAIDRTSTPVKLLSLKINGEEMKKGEQDKSLVENVPTAFEETRNIKADPNFTQPYWLLKPPVHDRYAVDDLQLTGLPENPAPLELTAELQIGTAHIDVRRPVLYRYINRLNGESITPVAYVPPASVRFVQTTLLFPRIESKSVKVAVDALAPNSAGTLTITAPEGWQVSPAMRDVPAMQAGEQQMLSFEITPTDSAQSGELKAALHANGTTVDRSVRKISYPHIPVQTLFPKSGAELVRTDAITLAKHVGYVMGSGDDVPSALRQLGCDVTLLSASDLAQGDLSHFDAIVTGIRAYTERPDLVTNEPRLFDYVAKGGTLIVQYNRIERGSDAILNHLGPYPFKIGHERVTVEEAPVEFSSSSPLLSRPNKITETDFAAWVQERGLYFASNWDQRYSTPFETHDPGEAPLKGSTLVAHYGKGVYIFTAFSWFRELPAGVPGAYRIFANFLSASKIEAESSLAAGR
jgi:LmbE family N-acetylglucosaminyl deacetylase